MFSVVAPARMARVEHLVEELRVAAARVLRAELDVLAEALRVARPSRSTRASTSAASSGACASCEGRTSRGTCGSAGGPRPARPPTRGRCPPRLARARPQTIGGSLEGRPRPSACRRPRRWRARPRESSGDAAGKPASMTSTPRRASARATSSFSAEVIVAPGDCSPSRKRRVEDAYVAFRIADHRPRCSAFCSRYSRVCSLLTRVEEGHHLAQLLADLLDDVVALLRRVRRRTTAGPSRSPRSTSCANVARA